MIAHNPDRSPPADRGDGDDHWRVADWKNAYATWQYAPRCRWWRGRKREDFAPALRLEPGDDIGSLAFIHLRETEGPGRVYSGHRPLGRAIVTVQEADGSRRLLTHGAHGGSALEVFEWGYGGHGPSNLSESIIDDAVDSVASCPSCLGALYGSDWGPDHCRFCHGSGKHPSLHQLYDAFKWNFIASWQDDDWQLSQRDILQWLISTPRRILIS